MPDNNLFILGKFRFLGPHKGIIEQRTNRKEERYFINPDAKLQK